MSVEYDSWFERLGVDVSKFAVDILNPAENDSAAESETATATAAPVVPEQVNTGGSATPDHTPADAKPTMTGPAPQVRVEATFYGQDGPLDCKATASKMARSAGANPSAAGVGIEMALSSDAKGHIKVDPEMLKEGRNYIEDQLLSGKPVVVGVSHSEQGKEEKNFDKITDHFVLITGRGEDEKGRVFYTFKDPATKNQAIGDDTNANNRFFVDDSGKLVRPGNEGQTDKDGKIVDVVARNYEVSLVLGNAGMTGKASIGAWKDPETADIQAVRQALKNAGKVPADSGPWGQKDWEALVAFQQETGLVDENKKSLHGIAVTPGGITPGDPTDCRLLGGFKNQPNQPNQPVKETESKKQSKKESPPEKPANETDDGGILGTVEGLAKSALDKLDQAGEKIVGKGEALLKDAREWLDKDDSPPATLPPEPDNSPALKSLALVGDVGAGAKTRNEPADVRALTEAFVALELLPTPTDKCDDAVIKAIFSFQKSMKTVTPDGSVGPGGKTEKAINAALLALLTNAERN
jgi:hypothetical protein